MMPYRNYDVPVNGEIKINLEVFPKEILEKLFAFPNRAPLLALSLPRITTPDGIEFNTSEEGSFVSFTFAALDIVVTEAE